MTRITRVNAALDLIAGRAEKAVAGPWGTVDLATSIALVSTSERGPTGKPMRIAYVQNLLNPPSQYFHQNNLRFIAKSRTDVPKLLAVVEYLMRQASHQAVDERVAAILDGAP